MKQQINVIDLDKTLIPYDTFRLLVKQKIVDFDLYIIKLTILRVFRFLSSEKYKNRIIWYFDLRYNDEYFINFTNRILRDIDNKVLELIKNETENGTINILLSASPDFFVKHVIFKLGWVGKGSYFEENGNFIHIYGKNKINWLLTHYSSINFVYNFAISDSSSDDDLLLLFKKNIKWTLH